MIFHIARRELHDNLTSLRFALITVLILGVMIGNAVVYLGEYRERIREYRRNVSESLDQMSSRTDRLYNLVLNGPGRLYKKPSALAFCADGGEAFLPGYTQGSRKNWQWGREPARFDGIWRMFHPQVNPRLWDILPDFTQIDWVFLITVVLSIVAILFTFDAISGERERGTLRLMLANSLPRDAVLLGKFLGALLTIGIPFLIAALINLFLLSTSGSIQLGAGDWVRLGVIVLLTVLYVGIFIALGLLVSSRARQSSTSLMILLLIWVVVAILMPSTLGSLVSGLKQPMTSDELRIRRGELHREYREQYVDRGLLEEPPTREIPPAKVTLLWGKYHLEESLAEERLFEEHLRSQIDQIALARTLTRTSPAAIVRYAIESLTGTGFSRHLQFLSQVKVYATQFRDFLAETDKADKASPHALFFKHAISEKPVIFDAIPKFEDQSTFGGSIDAAIVDILLLLLFLVVLFAGAFLSFLRVDVQ